MAKTIEFSATSFPSIVLREDLTHTWNDIGISQLSNAEQVALLDFLEHLGTELLQDFDVERVLLVKAANGVPQGVYGPAIFRDDDSIVLKLGANLFGVQQMGDRLILGNLKGKVTVTEEKDTAGVTYPKAFCSFVAPSRDVFKINISLATKELNLTSADLNATLINEESLLPFLRQVPCGSCMKMHELGLGEFQVQGITETEGEYGTSYKLHLADGRSVWARGNAALLLDSGWRPAPGEALCLVISHIEQTGDKYSVDCALRLRLPSLPSQSSSNHHYHNTAAIAVEASPVIDDDDIGF
ncbi:hypothetical protein [Nostoc sp. TCL26-01]|uniref:hypothetical protein n=1 Tax=Nostoc sp. TCL26-01 TaxID=2576904 RepID=UPI0015BC4F3B|nr:hypothetical protein [Nostoc sp. TCL26-01]QLE59812.1 hypothetical protein FD725_30730 [Nostoc sp. TCL26-01]